MTQLTNREISEFWFHLTEKYSHEDSVRLLAELIVSQGRQKDIDSLVTSIEQMNYAKNRRLRISIRSAHRLDESVRNAITQLLQKKTGAETVTIDESVDPALLGGFIAQALDWQIDTSVRHILETLHYKEKSNEALT